MKLKIILILAHIYCMLFPSDMSRSCNAPYDLQKNLCMDLDLDLSIRLSVKTFIHVPPYFVKIILFCCNIWWSMNFND